MKRYLIGLDNGGTSVKAALFDEDGNQVYVAQRKLQVITPEPGFMERDLEDLWQKNVECLKEIVQCSGVSVTAMKGLSFSGHGKGLYLLDKAGRPLGNGILSMDQRARNIVEEWDNEGISDKVFTKTYQKVQEAQPVALLQWMKRHARDIYDQIGTVMAVKDYIRYCLSNKRNGEYTDFSGSNLIDFKTRSYSRELLRLFGIEEIYDALPPLVSSTTLCACVSDEAAILCDLPAGLPMAAGMFDVDACSIGCGMLNPSQLTMIAGTWSINVFIIDHLIENKSVMFQSFYALPEYTLVEESSATSCGNLEWIMKEMLGLDDYQECNEIVSSNEPHLDDIIYLPFLYGSNEGNLNACFANMRSYHQRSHILRAVYEGVAFAHKRHLQRLLKNRSTPRAIRIAGGIIHSDIWLQIFADILQIPLEVVANEEFGTQGAAICVGVATGIYHSYEDAVGKNVHIAKTITPNTFYKDVYEAKYKQYIQLIYGLQKGAMTNV